MTQASVMDQAPQGMPSIRPNYGYYRQPNGWITLSPAADLDRLHYTSKGWTPLPQYGRIEMTSTYAVDHPLEALFMQGGAKELPREQVIEMALHINTQMIPGCNTPLSQYHKRHTAPCMARAYELEFPQIGPEDMKSYACQLGCDRSDFPTEKARLQHEMVAHKEDRADIRMGETLAKALKDALGGGAKPDTKVLDVLAGVGLNKTQIKALRDARLIEGDVDGEE